MITAKEEVVVGALLRGSFRRLLDRQKFKQDDLEIEYTESKGWFESSFFIEVTGDHLEVRAWFETLHKVIEDIKE